MVLTIVAASFAILYLVRDERSHGIFRFTHRRHQRSTSSSTPFIYNVTSDRRLWSWRENLFKFFHFGTDSNDSSAQGRPNSMPDGHRWHQTGSSDTWDQTVPQLMEAHNTPLQLYPYCVSPPPLPETPLPNPYGHHALIYNHDSSGSSVHLSDPRKASSLSSPTFTQSNQTFSSNLDLHRVMSSPPSSSIPILASSSSLRSGSPVPRQAVSSVQEPTVPPGIAQRTFEGGSKFLEAI